MNKPLSQIEVTAGASLTVFAFFHLNLAFSSIEEERRGEVIANCYWPLLNLAERIGPLGLEVSGYTLEEIAARDPAWIEAAKCLIAAGAIELIGSGYSQIIAPLVPARVTKENLRLGLETYLRLMGTCPRIALVNEQAYAAGLVPLYREAGFDALIMDYDNPAAAHPEWPASTQFLPQYALGPGNESIALIWSNTTLFQQLQRFAHGDIPLSAYAAFVRGRRSDAKRVLCLYASDAEIFDFRPGRFRTEEKLSSESEWARLEKAFAAVIDDGAVMTAPSDVLKLLPEAGGGQKLALQSAACPVPVKKQRKYNLARWAVAGRDNTAINAACERIYNGMLADPTKADWRELCYLWSSDFRTHLTEKRWAAYCARLKIAEKRWSAPAEKLTHPRRSMTVKDRYFTIHTPSLRATLDRRRGLALESLFFKSQRQPALGGLPHGFFDEIALAADWYTGDSVFEAPGEHKLTDLEWCDAETSEDINGDIVAIARIETAKGLVEKRLRFSAGEPRVDFDLTFHWKDWGKGVLRLGHFTLLPEAFDPASLYLKTCNGGDSEYFALAGHTVDHGAPVSFLVSSSHGLGLTEGWAEIGDAETKLKVEVDRATAPLLGLLTHRLSGKKLFCQFVLSALELDDTRKPEIYAGGPRSFRFSVSAA